jgi:hypothetical protein
MYVVLSVRHLVHELLPTQSWQNALLACETVNEGAENWPYVTPGPNLVAVGSWTLGQKTSLISLSMHLWHLAPLGMHGVQLCLQWPQVSSVFQIISHPVQVESN